MKKSILTLAVLAAVCPAAFAADADTIKTIVWNTTTDPVLTNLTFDYTGAQLKAGSNGKSYFEVVDVIGATGRKDDVGLRASEILCPWDNRSPPNGCIQ